MEIRRALDQDGHRLRVEPDFDVADDLDERAQPVRAVQKGARQADLHRDVVRQRAIHRPQLRFLHRRDGHEQQVGIVHRDVHHPVIVPTAELAHLVAQRERVAHLRVPDAEAGFQWLVRRPADFQVERQHEMDAARAHAHKGCAGAGKFLLHGLVVRLELARDVREVLRRLGFLRHLVFVLVVGGGPFLRGVQKIIREIGFDDEAELIRTRYRS